MADTTSQQAKKWYESQTTSDQAVITENYNGAKSSLPFFEWVYGTHTKQIEEGLKASRRPGGTQALSLEDAGGSPPVGRPPPQAGVDTKSGNTTVVLPPAPNLPLHGVPSMVGAQFDPSSPLYPSRGPVSAAGVPSLADFDKKRGFPPPWSPAQTARGQTPSAESPHFEYPQPFQGPAPPPPPSPTSFKQFQASLMAKRSAEEADMESAARKAVEDRKKQKKFGEMVAREEFAQAEFFERAQMIKDGHLGKMGGTAGGVAGGVGMAKAGLDAATNLVSMTNTFMDVTRELKMAKYAGTPLEEAQRTAAAQEKIPIVGKLLAGLTELASSGWKAHYAIRDMAAKLHDTNMDLGRFSAGMRMVEATRTVKDIERSMKSGEALAPSAAALEASESLLKNAMLPFETSRKRKQDISAAKELLDEAETTLFGDLAIMVNEFGEESSEAEEAREKIRELYRTRASIKKLEKTGKWEGVDSVDYSQTLPGFMDSVRKNEMEKRRRPGRFDD